MSSTTEFLKSISVRDSKRACTYGFDLDGQLTIVYGRNGCGKSRMLQLLEASDRKVEYLNDVFEMNKDYKSLGHDYDDAFSEDVEAELHKLLKSAGLASLIEPERCSRGHERLLKMLQIAHNEQSNIDREGAEHKRKRLMLIDQIEDSLHIGTQRKLVDVLLLIAPDVQFIVTTHSPCIVAKHRKFGLNLVEHTTFD